MILISWTLCTRNWKHHQQEAVFISSPRTEWQQEQVDDDRITAETQTGSGGILRAEICAMIINM